MRKSPASDKRIKQHRRKLTHIQESDTGYIHFDANWRISKREYWLIGHDGSKSALAFDSRGLSGGASHLAHEDVGDHGVEEHEDVRHATGRSSGDGVHDVAGHVVAVSPVARGRDGNVRRKDEGG
eukprot:9474455-Pyramimonas_sp.AAC.1